MFYILLVLEALQEFTNSFCGTDFNYKYISKHKRTQNNNNNKTK